MDKRLEIRTIAIGIAVIALLALLFSIGNAQTVSRQSRTPVLVELFTSEGCSSCPPADALLATLNRDQPVDTAEIIVLGEHVDYWDQLGWHDRFSSRQYTERQREYGSRLRIDDVYTPQMIVGGKDQFVGNDAAHALRSIANASRTAQPAKLNLSQPVVDGRHVTASVSTAATQLQGDLYAALVDPMASTQVLHGENGGHRLNHVGVVRSLQRIGSLKDLNAGPHPFTLTAPSDSQPGTMRLVVFAQSNGLGPVLGAVSTSVTP